MPTNHHRQIFNSWNLLKSCSAVAGALLIGFTGTANSAVLQTDPHWSLAGPIGSSSFGRSLVAADVDGDGYEDLLIGDMTYSGPETGEGRVYMIPGSASGLETTATWTFELNQQEANLGESLAVGDINGDNHIDLVIGARSYTNGEQYEGGVFLFLGSNDGFTSSPQWTAESNQDPYSDHRIGASVGLADVNNDGYDDVVWGAYFYEQPNAGTSNGQVMIWYGSADGPGENGTPANADWVSYRTGPWWRHGSRVGNAGDVNGDDIDDLYIATVGYSSGYYSYEGQSAVYLGSQTGLSASAQWSFVGGWSTGFDMGTVLAGAGDTNNDGFDDILTGHPINAGNFDTSAVYLFKGSSTGVSPTSSWQNRPVEQNSGSFAYSGESVGDVNGDGYSDILFGGATRRQFYQGTLTGPDPVPNVHGQPGASAMAGGDFNGDGLNDVVISPYNLGAGVAIEAWYSQPRIVAEPAAVDFGPVDWDTSKTLTFNLRNDGLADLEFTTGGIELMGLDAADFSIISAITTASLRTNRILNITVQFDAGALTSRTAFIRVHTNCPDRPVLDVPLSGVGIDPEVSIHQWQVYPPDDVDFGDVVLPYVETVPPDFHSIGVDNHGDTDLLFTGVGVEITGPNAEDFQFLFPPLLEPVVPSSSRSILMIFRPTTHGHKTATLSIYTNDHDEPLIQVSLHGNAYGPDLIVAGEPPLFGYQRIEAGASRTARTVLTNAGNRPLEFAGPGVEFVGSDAGEFVFTAAPVLLSLDPGSSTTVDAAFDPSTEGRKSALLQITTNDPNKTLVALEVTGIGGSFASFGTSVTPVLHLSADEGVSTDMAGKVYRWTDLSGNGNHAGQAKLLSRPQLEDVTSDILGINLRSSNYNNVTELTGTLTLSAPCAIVGASFFNGTIYEQAGGALFLNDYNVYVGAYRPYTHYAPPSLRTSYGDGTFQSWRNPSNHANSGFTTGSIITSMNNGTTDSTFLNYRAMLPRFDPMGGFDDGYKINWRGSVSELMVFDRELSPAEHNAINSYMANKYLIGISETTGSITAGQTGMFAWGDELYVNMTSNAGDGGHIQVTRSDLESAGVFSGSSAITPGGTLLAPNALAAAIQWTISVSDLDGLTYGIAIDAADLAHAGSADELVLLKRDNAESPWQPLDTYRVGHVLSAYGLTTFSDFAIGAAVDSGVAGWSLY